MIHQIPHHLIGSGAIASPPERRERSAIRLNFPVADMTYARREAQRLGGIVDDLSPPWAGSGTTYSESGQRENQATRSRRHRR